MDADDFTPDADADGEPRSVRLRSVEFEDVQISRNLSVSLCKALSSIDSGFLVLSDRLPLTCSSKIAA